MSFTIEELMQFVQRIPLFDSTIGLACCLRGLSALRDQRAEILPVRRPRAPVVVAHCMLRLLRILMFPFFLSLITDQLSLK
jgi:hypothetical protein